MPEKLKVLSIIGTRPEAVKMAPVIQALSQTDGISAAVCVTAQHRQMLDQVLDVFDIKPDFDLNLMRPNQSLAQITADVLTALEPVLEQVQPDWLLVQGDTTTVMASALIGYYHHIKVGHVEAGLRTHNKWQPFPEEINRRVAGVTADLHFAPTELSQQNLLAEGIQDWRIKVTGNPVVDALQQIIARPAPLEAANLLMQMGITDQNKRLVLITAHRRENFGKPLEDICSAIRQLAVEHTDDMHILYPVHLNPNVQEPVYRLLSGIPNITLTDPLDYLPLVHIMKHADMILTDSGGIQEEAAALKIPTLVLREVTERPEGLQTGVLQLVGTNPDRIIQVARDLFNNPAARAKIQGSQNPYGDGFAANRIVEAVLKFQEAK